MFTGKILAHIYVCIYMYIYVYINMYTGKIIAHICIHMYVYVHINIFTYIYMYMYISIYLQVRSLRTSMVSQALGQSTGNHAAFKAFKVPSLPPLSLHSPFPPRTNPFYFSLTLCIPPSLVVATQCNELPHAVTHCNTYCNTLHIPLLRQLPPSPFLFRVATTPTFPPAPPSPSAHPLPSPGMFT